jgi:ATP-dependent DNA helicase RecQ
VNSALSEPERREAMRRIRESEADFIFATPEQQTNPAFVKKLKANPVDLFVVDEAHCITQWGHDFRPAYARLGAALRALGDPTLLALTATATPDVIKDIARQLGRPRMRVLNAGVYRPNLYFEVVQTTNAVEKNKALLEVVRSGGAGIVYCATVRAAKAVHAWLAAQGVKAELYHGRLGGRERTERQEAFMSGAARTMVATNAFGMGIDRPDVRAVVHLSPPGSIEAYYQEVGRAGRDGKDAIGLLLVSPNDLPLRRALLERDSDDGTAIDAAILEHKWGLFLELIRWADGGSCRHDAILRYFGDEAETLAGCGRCDVCQALSTGNGAQDPDAVTLIVRKALSGVARVHDRFGLGMVVKLVRGESDERLARAGLTSVQTFGNLRDHSEDWLLRLLRRCVAAGWVSFTGGDRPVVLLTEEGRAVMKGARPARILLPGVARPAVAGPTRGPEGAGTEAMKPRRPATAMKDDDELDAAAQIVFDALRRHRLALAREASVPPYVIASDRTLRDLARLRPRTLDELTQAYGIGANKAERYGEGLLRVIGEAAANRYSPRSFSASSAHRA